MHRLYNEDALLIILFSLKINKWTPFRISQPDCSSHYEKKNETMHYIYNIIQHHKKTTKVNNNKIIINHQDKNNKISKDYEIRGRKNTNQVLHNTGKYQRIFIAWFKFLLIK